MRTLAFTTAITILIAFCAVAAIKSPIPAALSTPARTVSISLDELQRQVDVRSLPALVIDDLY